MTVTELVGAAFAHASARHRPVHEQWVSASFCVGRLLPRSHLMISTQEIGHLDVLLRSMEDEASSTIQRQPFQKFQEAAALGTNQLVQLSGIWVGAGYEVLRLLKSRKLLTSSELNRLEHDFAILRMPLDKHEIAGDRLLNEPLALGAPGGGRRAGDAVEYDAKDKALKAHAMPVAISPSGSVAWQAIDVARGSVTARWIERRDLADQMLEFFGQLNQST